MEMIINGELRSIFVEYKKKKHISVEINPEGFITVRAPLGISNEELEDTIKKLIPRIEKRLDKIAANKKIYDEGSYNDDEHFRLFGEDISFKEVGISGEAELKKFYFERLKIELENFLKHYSKVLGVKYKEYKITETKTTWGTCNSSKKLTFNLKLVMAPLDVVEYVVVHELAHLKHMNHDRSFWNLVGKILPDYKERQNYLKKYGQFMNL
ncbi:MAG: M48 family metallopeptidase [Tissierellia bacterium]|jgi:predicted metal-dependent hydrolase|nr:M48 family metallopeptidase [Tissierellia bacterium]